MLVHCIFFTPSQAQACQVLSECLTQDPKRPLSSTFQRQYCQSGCFISCPIFQRIQEKLCELNELASDLQTIYIGEEMDYLVDSPDVQPNGSSDVV